MAHHTSDAPSDTSSGRMSRFQGNQDRELKPQLKPGSRTCQCAQCDLFFASPTGFDRHLIGADTANPRCRTPSQMQNIGMTANKFGVWQYGISKKKAEAR